MFTAPFAIETRKPPGPATQTGQSAGCAARDRAPGLTVVTLRETPETVWAMLADVESLPRWAGGFCECVDLRDGRWAGLTSLGELFLEIDAELCSGRVWVRAGERAETLRTVELLVVAGGESGARVHVRIEHGAEAEQARLARALRRELMEFALRGGAFR